MANNSFLMLLQAHTSIPLSVTHQVDKDVIKQLDWAALGAVIDAEIQRQLDALGLSNPQP
jgi:hypothetical protein